MMGDLFAVDLSSVGVGTLQGLSDDWVQLNNLEFTGFRNMLM